MGLPSHDVVTCAYWRAPRAVHPWFTGAMSETITRASRDDAFALAALRLQMDLEAGESNRPGFLTEYADYFLAHFDALPTWIATSPDGSPLGMVQTAFIPRAPALRRPAEPMLYVAVVFVVASARGEGLAERMLRVVDAWADDKHVSRMMLNTRPKARSLYERVGFGAPEERHMHRDAPFVAGGGR